MQFDRNKFKETILYVANKCAPRDLGAVKLHKVLYFADMLFFIGSARPITGAVYRKRPMGPTADALLATIGEMQRANDLSVVTVDYFGYKKKEFKPLRKPIPTALSADEIALLDEVIEFVCTQNTAKAISEFSHQRPWALANDGDIIPYESAFLLLPEEASEEALNKASAERDSIAKERSRSDPMDFKSGADFRRQFQTI